MLRKNEVDLIFTLDSHIYDSEFIICAEHEEKVHFFASVDNPLLNKGNISLKELCTEDFVLTESNMSYRKLLNNELAAQSLEIHPVLEIGNPLQICSLIKNSKMISFLPDFITEDYYNSGEIKHLPVNDCDVSVWTQLLVHKTSGNLLRLMRLLIFIGMLYENKKYHILPYAPPYCVMIILASFAFGFLILTGYCNFFHRQTSAILLVFPRPRSLYPAPHIGVCHTLFKGPNFSSYSSTSGFNFSLKPFIFCIIAVSCG